MKDLEKFDFVEFDNLSINEKVDTFYEVNEFYKKIDKIVDGIKEILLRYVTENKIDLIETDTNRLLYNHSEENRLDVEKARKFIIEHGGNLVDYSKKIEKKFVSVSNKSRKTKVIKL